MSDPVAISSVLSGLSQIATNYDVIFSDVWGVVHNGVTHTPAAADALMRFRARGGLVILITNAPRPSEPIKTMLDEFGLPRAAYDGIVSSGDVTVSMIEARGAAAIHHIGPARDLPIFLEIEARGGAKPKLSPVDAADYVVCTGLYGDHDLPDAYMPRLRGIRARNLPMICANPDIVVHAGDDLLWCAGALADRYEKLGGSVIMAGKPFPDIYAAARAKAEAILKRPLDSARILAIGDGMFTDMRGAKAQGVDGLFISSGIHRDALHLDCEDTIAPGAYAMLSMEADAAPLWRMPHLVW